MKKILLILIAFISFQTLSSCREDGKFSNKNDGQFSFTVERDNDFIEKAIGETNQLKFNIEPDYDFGSLVTTFKFSTDLNGVLSLNGKVLTANKEYKLEASKNTFEYVGNVSGTHQLKISVKNEKGASKEESFELKYSVSEFSHTYAGGTGPIYQGENTSYLMKIIPGSGQPNTGYEIKFNTYSGDIKLNGVAVQAGQFYSLPNIDNFSVSLVTSKSGNGALFYTIKNPTVSKDYSIQQEIIAKTITVESLNITDVNIAPNSNLSLIGIIKKSPSSSNNIISYKTWISSASNNNISGVENTNNIYVSYVLASEGSFNYRFSAVKEGNYIYNIQFKDEFGNESKVKSFQLKVNPNIAFDNPDNIKAFLDIVATGGTRFTVLQRSFNRSFKVMAFGAVTITAVKYVLDYDLTTDSESIHINKNYNEPISSNVKIFERDDEIWTTNDQVAIINGNNFSFRNVRFKIIVTSSLGDTLVKEIAIF